MENICEISKEVIPWRRIKEVDDRWNSQIYEKEAADIAKEWHTTNKEMQAGKR